MREPTNPKTIAIRAALKAMNWNIPPPEEKKPEPWSCPSFTYSDYLASDHWAGVREGALERAGYACQLCKLILKTYRCTTELMRVSGGNCRGI